MNTEYAVGNIRIRFESRARRRWFVALFYTVLAVFLLATFFLNKEEAAGAWITVGCAILFVGLLIVFTWIAGDMRTRGDEREMHRRDHAHFRAYRALGYFLLGSFLIGALFAGYFRGPNPITSLVPLTLRGFLMQLPNVLLMATVLLYATLPQAILLWTELDMDVNPEAATH
jgi:hypothetical protein